MFRSLGVALFVVCIASTAVSALAIEPARDPLRDATGQLIGTWYGGPCRGSLTLQADGKFRRVTGGPAPQEFGGVWRVDWAAAQPKLMLHATWGDDEGLFGMKTYALVEATESAIRFTRPNETVRLGRLRP